jgi:hypothetical protein
VVEEGRGRERRVARNTACRLAPVRPTDDKLRESEGCGKPRTYMREKATSDAHVIARTVA